MNRANMLWAANWTGCVILMLALATACSTKIIEREATNQDSMPRQDINKVLEEHDERLMAVPGVVGVYVGLLDDDQTLCLKVMVVKKTGELEKAIPKSLEGYPVVLEETGVIRPLDNR